jgi:hypothetical protein
MPTHNLEEQFFLTARELNFDDLSREGFKPEVHLNNIYGLKSYLREKRGFYIINTN